MTLTEKSPSVYVKKVQKAAEKLRRVVRMQAHVLQTSELHDFGPTAASGSIDDNEWQILLTDSQSLSIIDVLATCVISTKVSRYFWYRYTS